MDRKLLVLDLDNTLFCWCSMQAASVKRSIEKVSEITKIPYKQLCQEHKIVLEKADSIEYPFAVQQLPSVLEYYKYDFDQLITRCLEPAQEAFKLAAYSHLKPYPKVIETLKQIKERHPNLKLCILTDAPLKPAIWRMYYLGILNYFDGIYGLENPRLPITNNAPLVSPRTLLKHLEDFSHGFIGRQRSLPNNYQKPDSRGFKNILMDFGLETYVGNEIIFAGDHVYKDIALAKTLGITSAHASYGLKFDSMAIETLKQFVPDKFIHKGLRPTGDFPQADLVMTDFSQILTLLT